jgi:hypothetical protein
MKYLKSLNYFFVGTPIILTIIGLLSGGELEHLIIFGLMFTMATGAFQLLAGISLAIIYPKATAWHYYLAGVVLFFSSWFIIVQTNTLNEVIIGILLATPVLLACYFTIILEKNLYL